MPTKAPQDHKAKDEPFTFTVGTKTYKLPPKISGTSRRRIPATGHLRRRHGAGQRHGAAPAGVRHSRGRQALRRAMKALKSLPTTRMLEVVGEWMGKAGGSSDS
jgi:hypothetical protein